MAPEVLGTRLKSLREAKGLTKYRLAKLSGVSETYIYRIERGLIRNPRGDTSQKIAKGLGITLAELIGDIAPLATWTLVEQSLKAYIPVYDEIGQEKEKEPIDYMAVTRLGIPPPTLRAYRIASLFLEPDVRPGDTVFVDIAGKPVNGDLVVVVKNGLSFLGRYHVDKKGVWLETATKRYSVDDMTVYGVVTGYGHVFRRT